MDEMFVPYKEMFQPEHSPIVRQVAVKEDSWNVFFLVLLVVLLASIGVAWYWYTNKPDPKPFRQVDAIPFKSIPAQLEVQAASYGQPRVEERVEQKHEVKVQPKVEPRIEKTDAPKETGSKEAVDKVEASKEVAKVEKVETPKPKIEPVLEIAKKEIVEYGNSHELAKGVGTKIRDMLLNHKQIPSLAVAAIVSSTVKVLLGENDRPQISKDEEKKEDVVKPKVEVKEVKKLSDSEEEPVKDTPRRGKINAETDVNLLKLLKDRGLK